MAAGARRKPAPPSTGKKWLHTLGSTGKARYSGSLFGPVDSWSFSCRMLCPDRSLGLKYLTGNYGASGSTTNGRTMMRLYSDANRLESHIDASAANVQATYLNNIDTVWSANSAATCVRVINWDPTQHRAYMSTLSSSVGNTTGVYSDYISAGVGWSSSSRIGPLDCYWSDLAFWMRALSESECTDLATEAVDPRSLSPDWIWSFNDTFTDEVAGVVMDDIVDVEFAELP